MSHLELLGYHDSGMEGWPQNEAPDSFWRTPVEDAARRLAELMRRYEPQVVVTYDENGFYGHPDHIQANRVTHAALDECGIPSKLYYTAVARSMLRGFRDVLTQAGIEGPSEVGDNPDFGTPDELITTTVDCSAVAGRKYASLAADASQSDNIFFLQMGEEALLHHHGIGELRPGRRLDRRTRPRGRSLRRPALSSEARAGPRPGRERWDAGRARWGPYVAVPAGVEPVRTRGADPMRRGDGEDENAPPRRSRS